MANSDQSQIPGIQRELDTIKQHVNYEPVSVSGQGWCAYPEIPTARDLNPDWDDPAQRAEITHLLPNTWQRPWSDKNTYLETHYRLQREEAITMLRFSIRKFRDCPLMMDDEETCVYTKVFVRGYRMTRLGPVCQIQFSTERCGKRIRWSQTRRLTTGALVVISTAQDAFRTICIPAIIADHPIRDGLDQNPPLIQIHWAKMDDAIMDPTIELVMIESRFGYFEAVRHSLVGLQQVAMTDTPLDKYLVGADKSDGLAQYVKERPHMNISSLVHHVPNSSHMTNAEVKQEMSQVREPLTSYSVIDGIGDQLSPYTNLDNSQLNAVHRILTKELAIVQGPPGTGKTFTSVQALQILLQSQEESGNRVIVVAAQTNHAVDQILVHLINLGFNVVRLGGRTQNEEIKRYSMYNLRRRSMPPSFLRADRDYKTFEAARKKNISAFETLVSHVFPEELLDPSILHSAGIISEKQLDSLLADDWESLSSPNSSDVVLSEWLGDQLIEVPPNTFRDPVFEDPENDDMLDLEDEDYQMDLDDCIVDDDENRGRIDGKWVPINHQWTGSNPHNRNEDDIAIRRELQKENLWDIDTKYRGAVYQYWQRELLRVRSQEFRNTLADNVRICKNLKINRWYKDTQCVKASRVEIIGCTTTGLCKYRGLLSALCPRTMLIEEAAETREANIISALYGSLQQLILVGDHQQLAPSCDLAALGEDPYYLRVSMFERLVKLNMPFSVLNMQRRMTPVLREVLNPFYPALQDHPVVLKEGARPAVPGMKLESFFFHHTWMEGTDENMSKYNILEAEMIVHFVDYLLMNGVDSSKITILTFYRGQRKKIMKDMRKKLSHRAPFTNVHTIDSYQGEENDIILLSLVRSNGPNGPHKAGFLRDQNRGVVAISRARRGFYIFGNMINLASADAESWAMWGQVEKVFRRQNRYGSDSRLPITCQQHGNTSWIAHPEDWINYHGGCTLPCPDTLTCGHPCGRRCHWVDHSRLICQRPCERVLPCGHRCQEVCGEQCRCTCHAFTGAYPDDEEWNEHTPFDERSGAKSVRGSGTNFADLAHRGRHNGLSGRYGSRGYRGNSTRNGNSIRSTERTQGNSWTNFNAQRDDARRREARQRTSQQGRRPPNALPSLLAGQNTARMDHSIRETYRPVTLSRRGKRNVGEGIVSESSGTPSPEKTKLESHQGYTPQVDGRMPRADFLDMVNTYHTDKLILPSEREASSLAPIGSLASSLNNMSLLDTDVVLDGPSQNTPQSDSDGQIEGSQLNEQQHYTTSMGDMVMPTAMRTRSNPRQQADRPEWEMASMADGSVNGTTLHHKDHVEDLIHF
ncbi:P-loop containing nucleoside triphosphate hydrolase protein [Biscogniauxia mediterranea]|nr:P-loop containing nucleoside triphosphate hydrolase protein [Biscogniauxia mediterranea]